jgi:hypothetical protein
MLELGPLDTLRGQDKVNLEQWVRKHYSDPRSKNKVKLNDMKQTTILEWCSLNTQLLSKPSSVPVGVVSLKHIMGFGVFKDCTVEEMVTSSHRTIHGQIAGSYLTWICTKDGTFNWSRYVYKIKRSTKTGAAYRFKTRLIVRGFEMEKGKDYLQNFSPTPGIAIADIITSIAAANDLELHSIDIEQVTGLSSY